MTIDPLVCPRGHHAIEINSHRFSCETCRNQGKETTSWDKSELVDLRESEPPLVTDGGVELPPAEQRDDVDETLLEDLLFAVKSAEHRGLSEASIAGALDAVAKDYGERAEIEEWVVLQSRFGVDPRETGARDLEELVEKATDDRTWYDPWGWL